MRRLRRAVLQRLALSEAEASFAARGFRAADPAARQRLEHIGATFIRGYNCALVSDSVLEAAGVVERAGAGLGGFAAEGAAMGAAIADAASLRPSRLATWIRWAAERFTYLVHVGAGWALARVPWRRRAIFATLDPVHCWLAYDGLGFHDAFFRGGNVLAGWRRVRQGYAGRAYDQGIGRALWFLYGADARSVARWIGGAAAERRADLWSGLGLAVAYAGGARPGDGELLARHSGSERGALAQGAAFAAEAHARAGDIPDWCAAAVRQLARRDAAQAVAIVRSSRAVVEGRPAPIPRYELWRLAVQRSLSYCPA
jgi:hypothetical protein